MCNSRSYRAKSRNAICKRNMRLDADITKTIKTKCLHKLNKEGYPGFYSSFFLVTVKVVAKVANRNLVLHSPDQALRLHRLVPSARPVFHSLQLMNLCSKASKGRTTFHHQKYESYNAVKGLNPSLAAIFPSVGHANAGASSRSVYPSRHHPAASRSGQRALQQQILWPAPLAVHSAHRWADRVVRPLGHQSRDETHGGRRLALRAQQPGAAPGQEPGEASRCARETRQAVWGRGA